ncbi:MAG: molybdopterin-dependent oxidoreductase [Rhodospirillales bacterium]|jgi:sulfite dehydrogenase (quinone) subunit SoeA|nr:molybdopterin-dependent oxidoreductase [Rhodospirillales bacterium]MBT4625310.1 molybdopterin-dependent oxidoreductase [Rhodospirillales bacterium]MBT5520242.1 molybdopterin-dependent oxidoreductase [Rhodospirillales bacterium]MBT6109267.1 molybdopterin-dependent oxidoreductase [Rhodospirillales bacterium]MBT6827283.1 molybdopterin-dependent oxidoreductase [Rhodospirillales bacterium]
MAEEPTRWKDGIDTSPHVSDEIKYTTCYMCACRCGIKVHLTNGKVRYIQGNQNHPINRGIMCGKGAAGIMTQYSPAKLQKPLKRVGPRGSGEFKEIEWEEALSTATEWLGNIRKTDPKKLAFFTGRDQSQALTGWWASQFGTPNYAAHGGFCSVNMAAGGLYSIGGSFWEFGEPDWDRTKYFMMFGVAEDHDSNPIKIGLGKLKNRGAKFVSVNPIRTGYSAISDEWLGIRPGTDGLFAMSLIHELLRADKIDLAYLARYTNAPWLVIDDPGAADDGMFARDEDGNPLCWDGENNGASNALSADAKPVMVGDRILADGRKARPAFQIMAERYMDDTYAPDNVAEATGIEADTIRRIAAELAHAAFEEEIRLDVPWVDWAGREQDHMIGRPVAMHAMRGISAHSNGFHTCRAIHLLQMILGTIDCPGGFRYKPPFPKPVPPGIKPTGKNDQVKPGEVLPGPPLGFPTGPEDLLVDENGQPTRIDKAFSWEHPVAAHGMMHSVITNAWKGDPYPIDTLMMFMANMSWNSTMNTGGVMDMLCDMDEETGEYKIPRIIYSDAYYSEMVAYADLILPDTTYLERHDCISLLDRPISEADAVQDAIRQPVVELDRDVRPFQSMMIDLGARLGLPGLTNKDGSPKYPGGYPDYIVNHERAPGIGPLAGWRGKDGDQHGRGDPNPNQIDRYIENQCFWSYPIPREQRFYKMANKGYLEWAASMGFVPNAEPIIMQIYSEPLQSFRNAARGHGDVQPPEEHRMRVDTYFDPLPIWYQPMEEAQVDGEEFPLHALTQRPMHMYHSWGGMNSWLRQITNKNRLYMSTRLAEKQGIADGDWIWAISHHGRIKVQAGLMDGVNDDTVWTWNAIGKRSGAWNLKEQGPESKKGFLLNHLISELLPARENGYRYANADPVTGQAAWYDLRVRIEKAGPQDEVASEPQFENLSTPRLSERTDISRYGQDFKGGKT